MVLELHVWGPAFSLPSIDAECLAAIAYLKRAVPKDEWALIASSEPSISPKGELPALKDGSTWVNGFSNVVDHVRQYSGGEWDLNDSLDAQERADCIAFSSLLSSQGQPLLDLSLYVSSLNYTSTTRSAYAQMLPWPSSWIYPPRLRATAKARSHHLGLSSLDIDSIDAPQPEPSTNVSQIPTHLLKKSKDTVSSLLGRGQQHNQFRLSSLTTSFFAPLEDLLSNKPFLLTTTQLSSLDCLAIGHLSLALFPELPHPWLQTALKTDFPLLASYTERVSRACFGPPVDPLNYLSAAPKDSRHKAYEAEPLPWTAVDSPSLTSVGAALLDSIADSLPLISTIREHGRLRHAASDPDLDHLHKANLKKFSDHHRREFLSQIVVVVGAISTMIGYMYYHGAFSPEPEENSEGIIYDAEYVHDPNGEGPITIGDAGSFLFGVEPEHLAPEGPG